MQKAEEYFKKSGCLDLNDNFFKAIGDDWLLITAGKPENFNTMTASWGAVGVLWNKPVAFCFVRPTRHTYTFANTNQLFTLSFFTESERGILQFCGSNSGRNTDKVKVTGLNPVLTKNEGISFEQSRLFLECRKVYFDDLKPGNFLLPEIDEKIYPLKDYHRMFIGEIMGCYMK